MEQNEAQRKDVRSASMENGAAGRDEKGATEAPSEATSIPEGTGHTREAGTSGPDQPASEYRGAVDFTAFILSLAQSVLIDLGVVPHPETGQVDTNLKQARHTIDILEMLQEKTRGNLSAEEHELLEGTLYRLRLSFVEVKHRHPAGR